VLDTNVIIASLRGQRGASAAVMRAWYADEFEAVVSVALFLEYEEVIRRPEQRLVHGLEDNDIEALLDIWASLFVRADINYRWRPQLSDSTDEMVLEAAVNGSVDAIVTFNKADFLPTVSTFGIEVWTPVDLLRKLDDASRGQS
jgi:putative PIN family toxin of toxin-antitoxin system